MTAAIDEDPPLAFTLAAEAPDTSGSFVVAAVRRIFPSLFAVSPVTRGPDGPDPRAVERDRESSC